jgi:hypothetical protein
MPFQYRGPHRTHAITDRRLRHVVAEDGAVDGEMAVVENGAAAEPVLVVHAGASAALFGGLGGCDDRDSDRWGERGLWLDCISINRVAHRATALEHRVLNGDSVPGRLDEDGATTALPGHERCGIRSISQSVWSSWLAGNRITPSHGQMHAYRGARVDEMAARDDERARALQPDHTAVGLCAVWNDQCRDPFCL